MIPAANTGSERRRSTAVISTDHTNKGFDTVTSQGVLY